MNSVFERANVSVGDKIVCTTINRRGVVAAISEAGDVTIDFQEWFQLPAFTRTFTADEILRAPLGIFMVRHLGDDGVFFHHTTA